MGEFLNPWADGTGFLFRAANSPVHGGGFADGARPWASHSTNTPTVGLLREIKRLSAYLTDSGDFLDGVLSHYPFPC